MLYTTALYTTPSLYSPKRTTLLTPWVIHQNVYVAKSYKTSTMFLGELQKKGVLGVVSSPISPPLQNEDGHSIQWHFVGSWCWLAHFAMGERWRLHSLAACHVMQSHDKKQAHTSCLMYVIKKPTSCTALHQQLGKPALICTLWCFCCIGQGEVQDTTQTTRNSHLP